MRHLSLATAGLLIATACAAGGSTPTTVATEASVTTLAPLALTTTSTVSTTTSPPETTATTEPLPLPVITISVAGDTSFTHGLAGRDPLGDVAAILDLADLAIVNLETTVAEPDVGAPIEKRFVFKSPPETAQILADAGVDVAALANNHALDYGPAAVIRTIELLNAASVATAGTGPDSESAYRGTRLDVAGWDVAVLSFTRVPCDSPEPGETYIDEVAWACEDFEQSTFDAVAAAADADLVIVMVHWGIQRRACPEDHQWQLAERWVADGADLVIGSHPHVLQGVARIDGAWLVHSTGNFAFPSAREASADSAVFTFTVAEGEVAAAVTPVRIIDGRPLIATSSRDRILSLITDRSFGFAAADDGRIVPTDETADCG